MTNPSGSLAIAANVSVEPGMKLTPSGGESIETVGGDTSPPPIVAEVTVTAADMVEFPELSVATAVMS